MYFSVFEPMSLYFDFGLGTMPDNRADSGNGAGKGPGRSWEGAEGGTERR